MIAKINVMSMQKLQDKNLILTFKPPRKYRTI